MSDSWEKKFYKMEPEIWGPTFWKTIYFIVFTHDTKNPQVREMVELFFFSLGALLPCADCQEHYQQYFQKNPIKKAVKDKQNLLKWVYHLQCDILKRKHGKNYSLLDFETWKKNAQEQIQLSI